MSDVIAAAAIAGGVGLAGNVVTFLATRYTTAQETLRRQREQVHGDRVARESKYSEFAWCLQRLNKYGTIGAPPSQEDWRDWLDQWAYWTGVIAIVGSEDVVRAADDFSALLDEIGPELLADAGGVGWREVYQRHSQRLDTARQDLLGRMRL